MPASRESEAPVEGEALDAVRLMTIHRAKGLEFEIVCVADLGRGPRWRAELMRVGRDGRFGLRLAEPGTGETRAGARTTARWATSRQQAEAREERRLFYVAMTRATRAADRSAARRSSRRGSRRRRRRSRGSGRRCWATSMRRSSRDPGSTDARRSLRVRARGTIGERRLLPIVCGTTCVGRVRGPAAGPRAAAARRAGAARGGAQLLVAGRVQALRLPVLRRAGARAAAGRSPAIGRPAKPRRPGARRRPTAASSSTTLLERLDFRRPVRADGGDDRPRRRSGRAWLERSPTPTSQEIADLVERFAATELCARLGRATQVAARSGSRSCSAGRSMVRGARRARARARRTRRWSSTTRPIGSMARTRARWSIAAYATQRLVYALAALRAGADRGRGRARVPGGAATSR